ncbi:DUF3858 domain-containing protein [Hymenobacter sp. B81]|uniref:DUF3858 domain-containing protein n=1 Tax=Hymenobacter sp. B81 TaxID=3344878 RepID=UPI0037DC1B34
MTPFLRRSLSTAALGCAVAGAALAQPEPIKFGKLDPKDFDQASFVADSAAEAVVLCDYGVSRFDVSPKGGWRIVFDRVTRIKILKKSGYDWASVEVPLYRRGNDEEKLIGLKAFTYNLGPKGEVVKEKMETSAVFTEQQDANRSLRKFTLPNVREGSVIEFAYTVNSDFLFNFQDWQFQHSIPVRWSEYRAHIPEYFYYKQLNQGYEPLVVQEQTNSIGQFTVRYATDQGQRDLTSRLNTTETAILTPQMTDYRWAMKNVPALRAEPYMTTPRDYVARIDFELSGVKMPGQGYDDVTSSWGKMQQDLLENPEFGVQLNKGGFLKADIAAIVAKYPNGADRAAAVHELVRKNVKCNGEASLWSRTGIRKTWEQHTGNTADVNLLLIALLRDAGLQANPVILSTRTHGRVDTSFPQLQRFNYVVAHVQLPDSQQVLADASEPLAPFGMLPQRCLSGQGRLIMDAKNGKWIPLLTPHRYMHFRSAQLTLDEKGNIVGKVRDEHDGYLGLHQRGLLQRDGEKKFVEKLLKEQESWKIDKFAFQQVDLLNKPLALDLDVRIPSESDQALGTIYLSPLSHLSDQSNPFKQPERRFPVDLGARLEETNMLTLTVPDNFTVEELPKNVVLNMPDGAGRFLFNITPVGNKLQIMSRLMLNRPVYYAEEYPGLREFYERALAKQAEKIVLKRKS